MEISYFVKKEEEILKNKGKVMGTSSPWVKVVSFDPLNVVEYRYYRIYEDFGGHFLERNYKSKKTSAS